MLSPAGQKRYDEILRRVVLREGSLVNATSTAYGWIASDWQHKHKCELTTTAVPTEITYDEWAGTFEPSRTKYAMQVDRVNCKCGQLRNRKIRWDATIGDAIQLVVGELIEPSQPQ